MGPQKRVIPISFAGGLDTKTDPKQVIPGKLLDLQNGIFMNTGAINRRWGYKALGRGILGTALSIGACSAIEAFNSELLAFDGTSAYSYIQATDAWAKRGGVVSLIQSNQQIIAGNNQQLSPDFATLNGVELYAWEDSRGGIRYSAFDAATGTILSADNPLFTGMPSTIMRPRVIAWQGLFWVLFATATNISYVTINPANPGAVPAASNALVSGSPTAFFDATTTAANGSQLAVLYVSNATGTNQVHLVAFAPGLSVLTDIQVSNNTNGIVLTRSPSLTVDPNGVYWGLFPMSSTGATLDLVLAVAVAVFFNGTNHPYIGSPGLPIYGPGLGIVASMAGITVASTTGTTGFALNAYVESTGTQTFNQLLYANTAFDNNSRAFTAAGAPVFVRSVGLASKPFSYNGAVYLNVAFQSQQQSTYFTLDANANVVGKVFAGQCGGLIANSDFMLPQCQQIATGIFKYANLVKSTANTEAGVVLSLLGVNATKLDFFDTNHFLSAGINAGLYTVGGILQHYDGAQYVEHGFHVYPEGFTLTPQNNGGGLMAAGTYFYAITYEWIDNTDASDLSTPSIATSVTVGGGNNSVQLVIPTLRLTKKSRVKIVIYRTQASGTILYRVTSAIAPLYNDPTVDTVTFVDLLADASIQANGAMYTQPLNTSGANPVCANSAPPACSLIATFANRVFLAGLDDPYTLWYSQQTLTGSAMQFSNLLALRMDPDGGPITALVRMDANLIIFKKNAIFYLTGQGPAPNGDQNDFGAPILIPSGEVGCVSQNTVALTPIGILFQTANGIYLLDRALNVSYKGAPVEKYNGLGISSATLIPNQWVVFTTQTSGTALVYDFYFDQWSTFTNHAAVDSCLYLGAGNLFAWANAAGQVYLQTPTAFSDAGAPIPFSLTTSWITFAGIQGYQRIYHALLLGQYKGTHTLSFWAGFDYDDPFIALAQTPSDSTLGISTFGSSSPFGNETPFGGAAPGQTVYQFRYDVLRKVQAVRFQISDLQTAPGNEGFSLSALSLVVGVKAGAHKVPAIKQFGVS